MRRTTLMSGIWVASAWSCCSACKALMDGWDLHERHLLVASTTVDKNNGRSHTTQSSYGILGCIERA